jgi:hypothetical protein
MLLFKSFVFLEMNNLLNEFSEEIQFRCFTPRNNIATILGLEMRIVY